MSFRPLVRGLISAQPQSYTNVLFVVCGGVADRLEAFDVSDPTAMVKIASVTSVNMTDPRSICVDSINAIAYVAGYDSDSITAFNISNPTNPVEIGNITSATDLLNPDKVDFVGTDYLMVNCAIGDTLTIVDISDPTNMSIVTTQGIVNGGRGLAYSASRGLIFARREDGLYAFGTSNLATLGTLTVEGTLTDSTNLRDDGDLIIDPNDDTVLYSSTEGNTTSSIRSRLATVDTTNPASMTVTSFTSTLSGDPEGQSYLALDPVNDLLFWSQADNHIRVRDITTSPPSQIAYDLFVYVQSMVFSTSLNTLFGVQQASDNISSYQFTAPSTFNEVGETSTSDRPEGLALYEPGV